jgi:UDPglucose 6-dehydrogenase
MKIAFAGLTHLGVCMSIGAHERGADVIAFDTNTSRVEDVRQANFDAAEPGVVDFLSGAHPRYRVTDDLKHLLDADMIMIALDTRLNESGANDDSEIVALLEFLATRVPTQMPIVVASQVRPGFSRRHRHLHSELYYFMETLIFGRGLERAMHPERYIVGVTDTSAFLPPALQQYLDMGKCPIHVMSYESAELTKLSANFVLSASITAANSLADLAQRLGANWDHIEAALRQDQRIGAKSYISAGLGIGGANLTRDLNGIKEMGDRLGADSSLATTMLRHSAYMRDWMLREIAQLRRDKSIGSMAVLGLAYKPGTQSMRGGAGIDLVETFESCLDMKVHDPAVPLPARGQESRATAVERVDKAMLGCDVIAITTPWPEYATALEKYLSTASTVVILDPFRIIDGSWVVTPASQIIQLGVSNEQP